MKRLTVWLLPIILLLTMYGLSACHTGLRQPVQEPSAYTEAPDTPSEPEVSAPVSITADMNAMREKAAQIEDAYEVRILLSDEGAELAAYCNRDIVLSSAMENGDEVERIGVFLDALEESLSLYPEGYFAQFRTDGANSGIIILPVAGITDAIGICYAGAEWTAVAIDIRESNLVSTCCHELWHATENKILSKDYRPFMYQAWAPFNPDDFQYNEIGGAQDDPYRWTLFDMENDAYFIDAYARTNGNEDRARLMEYVMTRQEFHDVIRESPKLMAKLQYLCEVVRQNFDTTNWGVPKWEALLYE